MIVCAFDYPPLDGGIARLCAEVAAGLGRRGAAVRVVTQDVAAAGAAVPRLPETRLTPRRPRRELDAIRTLRREKRGLVLCGTWYPEGLVARLAGVRDYVVLAHGMELTPPRARWRRAAWRRLQARVLTGARLVVANSEDTRRRALNAAPGCRAVAVPLAVDHDRFRPGDRAEARRVMGVEGRVVVGSVARLHAYKGHDVVLAALASLPTEVRSRVTYLVAGRGPDLGRLQQRAASLGIDEGVRWLGFVDESRLPDFYRACDLFALCTREDASAREVEGFGLAFLEAQACGTPALGTRTGGIPDAVEHGDGGWLIEQDDADALAGHLRRLVEQPEIAAGAGAAARARVERDFTWDHYLRRFEAALAAEGLTLG